MTVVVLINILRLAQPGHSSLLNPVPFSYVLAKAIIYDKLIMSIIFQFPTPFDDDDVVEGGSISLLSLLHIFRFVLPFFITTLKSLSIVRFSHLCLRPTGRTGRQAAERVQQGVNDVANNSHPPLGAEAPTTYPVSHTWPPQSVTLNPLLLDTSRARVARSSWSFSPF